jgi:hypothetical protein
VSVDAFRELLFGLLVGPVDRDRLVDVLTDAWDCLDRDDRSMAAFKLKRLEVPYWDGSMLTFAVERHGGTVLGSTRADVQHWAADPRAATARIVRLTHRQLSAMAPRLDVRPLAVDVAALILAGVSDDRLKWSWRAAGSARRGGTRDTPARRSRFGLVSACCSGDDAPGRQVG